MRKRQKYVRPQIKTKKVKVNFFLRSDSWFFNPDSLLFKEVYAQYGGSGTGQGS